MVVDELTSAELEAAAAAAPAKKPTAAAVELARLRRIWQDSESVCKVRIILAGDESEEHVVRILALGEAAVPEDPLVTAAKAARSACDAAEAEAAEAAVAAAEAVDRVAMMRAALEHYEQRPLIMARISMSEEDEVMQRTLTPTPTPTPTLTPTPAPTPTLTLTLTRGERARWQRGWRRGPYFVNCRPGGFASAQSRDLLLARKMQLGMDPLLTLP